MEAAIVDEQEEELGSPSSSSSSEESSNSVVSSSSDFMDDATSSSSSSSNNYQIEKKINPLYEMSELMEELPIKRGLSKHFEGKSQSFTSLSKVRCLEDLAKPAGRMCGKRMKSCKSYAGGLDASHNPLSPKGCIISKNKPFMGKRNHHHHHYYRPPIHPHSSGNLSSQTLLFA